jgi:hypothetical protein
MRGARDRSLRVPHGRARARAGSPHQRHRRAAARGLGSRP